ncbi:MAG: SAM-dependent DNA methyltransferase [Verrucomicrobia bacterium]|nr:SAM-dependent DNA methyltransferase [Verrucomicrobiota bacterium]
MGHSNQAGSRLLTNPKKSSVVGYPDLALGTSERSRLTPSRFNQSAGRRAFPAGKDPKGRPHEDFRWSRFKHFEAKEMFAVVNDHVFPFLRTMGGDDSTYAHHMKDARFTIPTPTLLAKVVDMIAQVPMEDRDTKGDLYEYMLGKIATAGQNGQFRTPRHIIELMVELVRPVPTDIMCDPASGTCGFPVAVGEYLRRQHPEIFRDAKLKAHFHHGLFHAFDFDNSRRARVSTACLREVGGYSFRMAGGGENLEDAVFSRFLCSSEREGWFGIATNALQFSLQESE